MYLPENTLLQGGKYKIVRFISAGGFGCTYEAEHVMLHKRVAIKEFFVKDFCNRDETTSQISVGITSKTALVDKLKKKFIEEAQSLCALEHPNIVHVFDVFEENGTAYYVMDYIDGPSLNDLVKKDGPMSEQKALGYIKQVADALKYVHSRNRLHLDIKPGNIMVDEKDRAILIDFGASKQYDEEAGENTSTLLGKTPGYAPLEQMGNDVVKFLPSTDIYALGATLYKLLTGITPPSATLLASGETFEEMPSAVSGGTRNAIIQSMQTNKMKRPQNVGEFEKLLSDDVDERTIIEDDSVKPTTKKKQEGKKRPQTDSREPVKNDSEKLEEENSLSARGNSNSEKITSLPVIDSIEKDKSRNNKKIIPLIIVAVCIVFSFISLFWSRGNSKYLSTDLDSLAYSYGVVFGDQYSSFQDKDTVILGISMQINDFLEGFLPAIKRNTTAMKMSVDEASKYIEGFWNKVNNSDYLPLEYDADCQKLALAYGIIYGNQYSNFTDHGIVVPNEVMNLDKFLDGFTRSIRRENELLAINVETASSYIKNFSFAEHQQKVAQRKGSLEEQMRALSPVVIEEPSWEGKILSDSNLPTIKLKQLSCVIDTQMSEDKKWYDNKGLKLSTYVYPKEIDERIQIPANIPYEYNGLMISCALSLSTCNIYLYGNTRYADSWKKGADPTLMLITDMTNSNILHFLSFERFQRAPHSTYGDGNSQYDYFNDQSIHWAQVEDNILYISHGNEIAASFSNDQNAYITAISLIDYSIIWTSKPLSCNSFNFLIKGNSIVTGYGFTDESHYILVLDRFTGKQVQKLTNRYPYYIFEKDDKIVVTTAYDKIYTYQIVK